MPGRPGFRACGWCLGLCVFLVFLAGCETRDRYVGVYEIEAKGPAREGTVILELKANGDGLWKVRSRETKDEFLEIPFAWYIKRGDLRINTRAGGVIVAKIDESTIRMTLPGPKELTFRRSR